MRRVRRGVYVRCREAAAAAAGLDIFCDCAGCFVRVVLKQGFVVGCFELLFGERCWRLCEGEVEDFVVVLGEGVVGSGHGGLGIAVRPM